MAFLSLPLSSRKKKFWCWHLEIETWPAAPRVFRRGQSRLMTWWHGEKSNGRPWVEEGFGGPRGQDKSSNWLSFKFSAFLSFAEMLAKPDLGGLTSSNEVQLGLGSDALPTGANGIAIPQVISWLVVLGVFFYFADNRTYFPLLLFRRWVNCRGK